MNTSEQQTTGPAHVAIIMDGNGRWAQQRGKVRTEGHKVGAEAVRRTVEASRGLGIRILTLYAFSSDNWNRPKSEVHTLMRLLNRFLGKHTPRMVDEGVRLNVIGRRDRLAPRLLAAVERAEERTSMHERFVLRLAVDYSARDAITRAAGVMAAESGGDGNFRKYLNRAIHANIEVPEVDLLIRTGGERRLSDFLLWELAYSELFFTAKFWPDCHGDDLAAAVADFKSRQRRFGLVPAAKVYESPALSPANLALSASAAF